MQTTPPNNQFQNQRDPRLRLPFEKRRMDFVTWTYIHRAGIYMIVIVFLLFGIAFVSCKIQIGQNQPEGATTVLLDFQEVRTPEEERLERLAQLAQEEGGRSSDYSDVSNRQSNENARLNSNTRDAQGATELYKQTARLKDQMAANRAEYEAGLSSEQNILSGGGSGSGSGRGNRSGSGTANGSDSGTGSGTGSQRQDSRVAGRVTVSFSFKDPVRTSVHLPVPSYLCQAGGEVVVNVSLNKNGNVISATVDRSRSSSDECLRTTAEKEARNSRFNVDNSAPARQSGTITYIFIPQ